jgi:hypothetical protein
MSTKQTIDDRRRGDSGFPYLDRVERAQFGDGAHRRIGGQRFASCADLVLAREQTADTTPAVIILDFARQRFPLVECVADAF